MRLKSGHIPPLLPGVLPHSVPSADGVPTWFYFAQPQAVRLTDHTFSQTQYLCLTNFNILFDKF